MTTTTAIILSIGDELVLGQTVDTNSAWISQQLAAIGCAVAAHMTVPDDQPAIELAIRDTAPRCDFLIITGGIGPTADDLTRQALAAVMNAPLELNETWLRELEKFFLHRGRPMPEINKIQAMIPRAATMIPNTCGTAAGLRATLTFPPSVASSTLFITPGVPKEMKAMFARDILPVIQQHANGSVILSRTLHTFGLGESALAEILGQLMDRSRNPSVGTTVSDGIVSLRLNSLFPSKEQAHRQIEATEAACREVLGDLIFGQDDQTLPQVLADLLRSKIKNHQSKILTVATAESCTAGLLAKMLTDIPGSSSYYKQGWITYTNQSKIDRLGVPSNLIGLYGAVSEPVVQAMASGALRLARTDFALAISGVAGPDGGSPAKPVGTVCIALAHPAATSSKTFHLFGDREMVRDRAAKMALTMLRFHLLGKPLPF